MMIIPQDSPTAVTLKSRSFLYYCDQSFESFFTFLGQNQLNLHFNSLVSIVSKLISKNSTCFQVKFVGVIVIFGHK